MALPLVSLTRRRLLLSVQAVLVFVVIFVLSATLNYHRIYSAPVLVPEVHHVGFSAQGEPVPPGDGPGLPGEDDWVPPSRAKHFSRARKLLPSILDPSNTSIDRMTCPSINTTRYSYLRPSPSSTHHEYIFALNLREIIDLTPRLLGSIIEAILFLGPSNCALSIVEGNSRDGTLELLRLLAPPLAALNIPYFLVSSPLDPSASDRIKKLAILRALALEPLTGPLPSSLLTTPLLTPEGRTTSLLPQTYYSLPSIPISPSPTSTILFINDVSLCAEDALELLHQRLLQSADMVCAMDWAHNGATYTPSDPIFFYDVWIARTLSGNIFFDINPETGSWSQATNLFPQDPISLARFNAGLPFQVFSCWNGAVAFSAAPIIKKEVNFRWPRGKECFQGEAQLFCKDMWTKGYGRIAVVPSVNLEYSDGRGRQTKEQKGWVSEFVEGKKGGGGEGLDERIEWKGAPERVVCMPSFGDQTWRAWNESVGEEWEEGW